MKQVSVSLPDPVRRKIDKLAKQDSRSRSIYIARVVEAHLAEREGRAA